MKTLATKLESHSQLSIGKLEVHVKESWKRHLDVFERKGLPGEIMIYTFLFQVGESKICPSCSDCSRKIYPRKGVGSCYIQHPEKGKIEYNFFCIDCLVGKKFFNIQSDEIVSETLVNLQAPVEEFSVLTGDQIQKQICAPKHERMEADLFILKGKHNEIFVFNFDSEEIHINCINCNRHVTLKDDSDMVWLRKKIDKGLSRYECYCSECYDEAATYSDVATKESKTTKVYSKFPYLSEKTILQENESKWEHYINPDWYFENYPAFKSKFNYMGVCEDPLTIIEIKDTQFFLKVVAAYNDKTNKFSVTTREEFYPKPDGRFSMPNNKGEYYSIHDGVIKELEEFSSRNKNRPVNFGYFRDIFRGLKIDVETLLPNLPGAKHVSNKKNDVATQNPRNAKSNIGKRDKLIKFRCNEHVYELANRMAKLEGVSVADLMHKALQIVPKHSFKLIDISQEDLDEII